MLSRTPSTNEAAASLKEALLRCKQSFITAGVVSFFINLLVLVPMIYMMQVYDRVMASGSLSTLGMLTVLLVFLLAVSGGLEWIRSQILIVTSNRLDHSLNTRVYDAMFTAALQSAGRMASAQPLGDLLQLRQFLTGNGLFAFFDAPWLPFNIIIMWWFHWTFGVAAIISAFVLMGLNLWNELSTRELLSKANAASLEASNHTQRNLRNIEVIESMGMLPSLRGRWLVKQNKLLSMQAQASARASLITATSKLYRTVIQSLILGLGAWLAIEKEISPGAMIAGSMLLGRALAPLDYLIGSWKGFVGARDAYGRLDKLLKAIPLMDDPMPLPPPTGQMSMESVAIVPPGSKKPIIAGVSLAISAGQLVAVIGPSAAGKSTLIRAMLGLYKPAAGSVRIDGADINQWSRDALGPHIGYLPQDVELLDGTISENIARFGEVDPEQVVAAAQRAGIHDMLLQLPEGYDTIIQGQGGQLSAGQRQRLGLARAMYGSPRIVVLDEPNSNLDQDGELALAAALGSLKAEGITVVVVTHRPSLLQQVDLIAFMRAGQLAAFGPRDEVLKALNPNAGNPQPAPATVTAPIPRGAQPT